MKDRWCWRCGMVIPMLDEKEFARVAALISEGLSLYKSGSITGRPKAAFAAALQEYKRITGFAETNGNALWHHRLSLYGPECTACGHPLRTPKARHCASCGKMRSN